VTLKKWSEINVSDVVNIKGVEYIVDDIRSADNGVRAIDLRAQSGSSFTGTPNPNAEVEYVRSERASVQVSDAARTATTAEETRQEAQQVTAQQVTKVTGGLTHTTSVSTVEFERAIAEFTRLLTDLGQTIAAATAVIMLGAERISETRD
jgi:hypothetical protein